MEVAILNKMVKVGLNRTMAFERGVKIIGHVIAEGKMFQARGTVSAKVLGREYVSYVCSSAKSSG